jgi:hypothetical protein
MTQTHGLAQGLAARSRDKVVALVWGVGDLGPPTAPFARQSASPRAFHAVVLVTCLPLSVPVPGPRIASSISVVFYMQRLVYDRTYCGPHHCIIPASVVVRIGFAVNDQIRESEDLNGWRCTCRDGATNQPLIPNYPNANNNCFILGRGHDLAWRSEA